MTRPLRLQFAGALYHVMNRGNARQPVFLDDRDHHAFLDLIGQTCVEFDWHCHAHCLMPNHFHLLLQTRTPNLARGMRQLAGIFTQRYNKRHARVGHLFQGRYKSFLIEDGRYLMEVACYIVLNPVRAKLVRDPAQWRWSAYAWLAGQRPAPAWADPGAIWSALATDPANAARVFREQAGRATDDGAMPPQALALRIVGSDGFRAAQASRLRPHRADPRFTVPARHADRPSLAALFAESGRRAPGAARDEVMREAVQRWGYTQTAVAAQLGMHPASVSRLMARARMLRGRT